MVVIFPKQKTLGTKPSIVTVIALMLVINMDKVPNNNTFNRNFH